MSKILILLLLPLMLLETALGQIWIERTSANGAFSLERNPNYRCNVPRDARGCERDPNICNGRNYCESSHSSRLSRWWNTSGTFRARGYGNDCSAAKRAAVETLYANEDDLCGSDGMPTCLYGRDQGPCYHDGRRFVSWIICSNDRNGAPAPSSSAGGLLLLEILRRPRRQ